MEHANNFVPCSISCHNTPYDARCNISLHFALFCVLHVSPQRRTVNAQRVLAEEHYNLGRAAKRLGIHRTTLWRHMKNTK